MSYPKPVALVWLRRDLRLADHAALAAAVRTGKPVYLAFVFDTEILDGLPADDRRVSFIHGAVSDVDQRLRAGGAAGLFVGHGRAEAEIPRLAALLHADEVFAGRDYEPRALARDNAVAAALQDQDADLTLVLDQSLHAPGSVLTGADKPYTVFTPFKRRFLAELTDQSLLDAGPDPDALHQALASQPPAPAVPELSELGFTGADLASLGIVPSETGATDLLTDFAERIGAYDTQRDFPGVKGVSYLSVHLRFGTLSIRAAARLAWATMAGQPDASHGAQIWLSELIWREFYMQILHHFPHVDGAAFKPAYDQIRWVDDDDLFAAWCEGRTGYPLIDAAMAQINQTGYMHNRLRMVVASFLTKDLGIDWRRGEAYFARQLIDFDLAANNGGWQWAASSGCDAQPYFRIFNPITQSTRFDPRGKFIRRYLPQLAALTDKQIHAPWLSSVDTLDQAGIVLGRDYPRPVVDHAEARRDTLLRYDVVKRKPDTD